VANPINRYTIGDRTSGLIYNEDGTLTVTFSYAAPTNPAARANWLPVPVSEGGIGCSAPVNLTCLTGYVATTLHSAAHLTVGDMHTLVLS
jgi:hypothetical protein